MDGQNNPQNPQAPAPAIPAAPVVPQPTQEAPQPGAAPMPQPAMPAPASDAPQPAISPTPPPDAPAPAVAAPTPQPAAAVPAGDSMQQTMPVQAQAAPGAPSGFSQQPPVHKKGISIWLVMSFIVLLFAGIGGYYFYTLDKAQPIQQATRINYPTKAPVSPTAAVSLSPSPSSTPSAAGQGTVSGTLCYPSSAIPAGTITAKNVTTTKLYTQAYAGTAAGGGTKYTFGLPPGIYRLKFTPTQYPTTVGYYTDYSSCVGNPVGPNCSGQKVRPLLMATVSANMVVQNVNLCDYYYPPTTPPQF